MTDTENKTVFFISLVVAVLMMSTLALLGLFPGVHTLSVALDERVGTTGGQSVLAMLRDDSLLLATSQEYAEQKKHQLRLEIPSTTDMDGIEVNSNYMARSLSISIPGIGKTYFYDYPMIGDADGIVDLWYDVTDGKGTIDIQLDNVYECETTLKDRYLYLDFLTPHEKYDYVVAIDAGHGGKDVGANIGETYEKDINLQIVLQLKNLFDEDENNIGVYYTRNDDSDPSLSERVDLSNTIQADAFVSVHINSTDSGRESGIHGTSVLYLVSDKSGASKALAENCLNGMLINLGSTSKGLVAGDEIKIIRLSEAPVALCEVGFITNPQERALLVDEDYQKKAAQGIYEGILATLGL